MKKISEKSANKNSTTNHLTSTNSSSRYTKIKPTTNSQSHEPIEAKGKTDSVSSKSKLATKGKLLVTSSHVAARSKKLAKHPAGKERMPSTMKFRQQHPLQQAVMQVTNASIVTGIDKAVMSVPLTVTQLDGVVYKALQLVKQKHLTHRSSKSQGYKYLFVHTFDGGSKVVFNMVPNKKNIIYPMQVIFNPNHISETETEALIAVWKSLFGPQAREVAASMRFMRVDVNADSAHLIDNLIIDLNGAKVGQKYFVKTDTGGKLQSSYVGGEESAHHGFAYDQVASDEYKASVGEFVGRQKFCNIAELVFEQTKGRTRIESRRVFKPHVTLAKLAAMTNPFSNYKVYDLSKLTGKKSNIEFLTYLDCVRIRGIYGANRYLSEACGKSKEGIATIHAYEERLNRLVAPWWRPQDFNASLLSVLKKTPVWQFLKVMEK
jgi:hypothetical protein